MTNQCHGSLCSIGREQTASFSEGRQSPSAGVSSPSGEREPEPPHRDGKVEACGSRPREAMPSVERESPRAGRAQADGVGAVHVPLAQGHLGSRSLGGSRGMPPEGPLSDLEPGQ